MKYYLFVIILFAINSCKEDKKIEIGDELEGGYVYYVNDWQYKIVKKEPFGEMTYDEAEKLTEKYFDGKKWWMPTQDELRLVYENIYLRKVGNIPGREYWSSDWFNYGENVYTIDFWGGNFKSDKNKNTSTAYFIGVAWRYLPKD